MVNPNRWTPSWVRGALVICSLALSVQLMAQQPQQMPTEVGPPGPAKAGEKTEGDKVPGIRDQSRPRNDRVLRTPPNFLTVENASHVPPLTAGQKFELAARSAFAPYKYPYVAVRAGINQADNNQAAFGQGFRGYAKRYGSSFADSAIGSFMTKAAFPSLLRQDPRYYRMGTGGFSHRAAYAASRVFVTRTDSGQEQLNFSELFGRATAAAISNAYHPRADRTLTNNLNIWWTYIAGDAAVYELREFWPDIRRRIHKP
ncbi:MAG: hypothetical protein LAO04_00685 [Acidobacteriia bacterium]|nr:hypothetical protein [Terriglobia bacterium]